MVAHAIVGFSLPDRKEVRHAGDRNALWYVSLPQLLVDILPDQLYARFFVIALAATFSMATQQYNFAHSAAVLASRLRKLSFKAMLRQDGPFTYFSFAFGLGC